MIRTESEHCGLTSQDVVLMILICLAADFDQTSEAVVLNELMYEILVHLLEYNAGI